MATTWLVERALWGSGPLDWQAVAGYGRVESAREHVRQCRLHSHKQGYALRVRLAED